MREYGFSKQIRCGVQVRRLGFRKLEITVLKVGIRVYMYEFQGFIRAQALLPLPFYRYLGFWKQVSGLICMRLGFHPSLGSSPPSLLYPSLIPLPLLYDNPPLIQAVEWFVIRERGLERKRKKNRKTQGRKNALLVSAFSLIQVRYFGHISLVVTPILDL